MAGDARSSRLWGSAISRPPVVAAWGAGVDSTAMIVEMAENGEPIDMVLFADPGSEKAGT